LISRKTEDTQRLLRAIVVLIRNTTWKCGKLERLIVRYLNRRTTSIGKSQMIVNQMISKLKLTGRRKSEFLAALKRLERRKIVRISSVQI